METLLVVRGRLKDRMTIELDEPASDVEGRVEITLRPVKAANELPLYETVTPRGIRQAPRCAPIGQPQYSRAAH